MSESVSSGLWSDEDVERGAKALRAYLHGDDGYAGVPWAELGVSSRLGWMEMARAVLGSVSVVHGDKQRKEKE